MTNWTAGIQRRVDKLLLKGLYLASRVRQRRFRSRGVLLVSYPRSGSSWVGKVLATSEEFAYLREPVTQPYLKLLGGEHALVDPAESDHALTAYAQLSREAFAGIPSTHYGVVDRKRDFLAFSGSHARALLIKEVNPKALPYFCEHYHPFVILLMRHPAAVALSFKQKGWLDKADTQADSEFTVNMDAWGKFGYAYGECLYRAHQYLADYADKFIVQYEDLANYPEATFRRIFNVAGIKLPAEFDKVIQQYCYGEHSLESGYHTQRDSRQTALKWKQQLTQAELESLKEGYFLSSLKYYRNPEDWQLNP